MYLFQVEDNKKNKLTLSVFFLLSKVSLRTALSLILIVNEENVNMHCWCFASVMFTIIMLQHLNWACKHYMTIYPEVNMDACIKCHFNPSNSCWHVSVWIKVVDQPTDLELNHFRMLHFSSLEMALWGAKDFLNTILQRCSKEKQFLLSLCLTIYSAG